MRVLRSGAGALQTGGLGIAVPEPDYAGYIAAYNAFMRPAVAAAIAALGVPAGSRGLDAGCGGGDVLGLLAARGGPQGEVVGVDVSRTHLEVAAAQAAGLAGVSVHPEPVDLTGPLPFDDRTFDWVWCADVVTPSAFPDPAGTVAEFARVTRPGGTVALFCNNWQRSLLLPGHRALEFALVLASETVLRPPVAPGPDMDLEHIAGWLRQAGLDDVTVTPHPVAYAAPLPTEARAYVDYVLEEDYLAALDVADVADRDEARALLTAGSPEYLPDQPHYYCLKTGVLATGTV